MVLPTPMALRVATLLVVIVVAARLAPSSAGDLDFTLTPFVDGGFDPTGSCIVDGIVGDLDDEEEAGMESETARRVLAAVGKRFISYGALEKDRVPCNRRGQSYYNCAKRGRANPYRRACTAITRCARDLS